MIEKNYAMSPWVSLDNLYVPEEIRNSPWWQTFRLNCESAQAARNILEAQVKALEQRLVVAEGKAALADELAGHVHEAIKDDWLPTAIEDFIADYDSLSQSREAPSTGKGPWRTRPWHYLHRIDELAIPGALEHEDGRVLGLDWESDGAGLLAYLNDLEAERDRDRPASVPLPLYGPIQRA